MPAKQKKITITITETQHNRITKLPREIKLSEPLRQHLDLILDGIEKKPAQAAAAIPGAPEVVEPEKK